MIIRGVNVFPTQIEEQILKVEQLSPHYQLEITREKNLDNLTVNVESRSREMDATAHQRMARELEDHVKNIIGITTVVRVHEPGTIVRSRGKAQRVIDSRR